MSRKRKSEDSTSTEIPTAAAATVEETSTAVADVPQTEPKASFADRVRKHQTPDPFGVATDNVAGVRLFYSGADRQVAIKFGDGSPEQKPSQAVIDLLKGNGFRWNPSDRIWTHPTPKGSAMSVRIEAEQLYQEIRQIIREEKGIAAGQEMPF